jgi:hypothetical protein
MNRYDAKLTKMPVRDEMSALLLAEERDNRCVAGVIYDA